MDEDEGCNVALVQVRLSLCGQILFLQEHDLYFHSCSILSQCFSVLTCDCQQQQILDNAQRIQQTTCHNDGCSASIT